MRAIAPLLLVATMALHAAESNDWTLRFRVVDSTGKSVAGVQLWEKSGPSSDYQEEYPDWFEMSSRTQGIPSAKYINGAKPTGTVSGADGIVDLKLPPPAEHACTLFHPNFITLDLKVDGKTHPLNDKRVMDFGDVKLDSGNSVKGTLKDKDGNPVKDAWVAVKLFDERTGAQKFHFHSLRDLRKLSAGSEQFQRLQAEAGKLPPPLKIGLTRTTRTAADGTFELRGLSAAKWHIAAWSGRIPVIIQVADFSDTKPGESRTQTIDFKQSTDAITIVARRGDQPLVDVLVRVMLNSDPPTLDYALYDTILLWGKTNAAGRLDVVGLPPKATVRVMISGKTANWYSEFLHSGDTATAQFDDAVIRFKLKSDTGEPIKAAKYSLYGRDANTVNKKYQHPGITSAAGGIYHLKGDTDTIEYRDMQLGEYALEVTPAGHPSRKIEFKVDGKLFEQTLEFAAGNGSLNGKVIGASGTGIGGIKVSASNEFLSPLSSEKAFASMARTASTKEDGSFEITGLAGAGERRFLFIDAPGHLLYYENWQAGAAAEDGREIHLLRAGAVHGTLVSGNKPVDGKRVELWHLRPGDKFDGAHADLKQHMLTGPDGKFQMTRIDPGDYEIRIGKTVKSVEINGGKDEDMGNVSVDEK